MASNNYPRVLLLGHQFNDFSGIGVTLSNLFYDWPKDRIGVMAHNIYVDENEKSRPCSLYIGKRIYGQSSYTVLKKIPFKNVLKKLYTKFGIEELKYKFAYSQDEIAEAVKYNPDLLFCCLGSLNSMKECLTLKEYLPKARLVIYILDDWVNTKENDRLFSWYWRKQNDMYFRELIAASSGRLSICQYMSDFYFEKYGKSFVPFHNPVDMRLWNNVPLKKKYQTAEKTIIYAGKINSDTKDCLLDFAKVISDLNHQDRKYVFDVYTPNYDDNPALFSSFSGCHVFPSIPHSDVPAVTKSYDASLLTLGFSERTKKYVRLSMSTKVSEILASGIPTILYCPSEIALAKYLIDNECVISCTNRNTSELRDAVSLLTSDDLCTSIVKNALFLAEKHDNNVVRACFRKTLESFTL